MLEYPDNRLQSRGVSNGYYLASLRLLASYRVQGLLVIRGGGAPIGQLLS